MAGKKSAMNYEEHEKTYNLFIAMSKYSTVALVVILVLMAIFLL